MLNFAMLVFYRGQNCEFNNILGLNLLKHKVSRIPNQFGVTNFKFSNN